MGPLLLTYELFAQKLLQTWWVLLLSFKVSKMLELIKQLLLGDHDNHSITECFFQLLKNVTKNTQLQMLSETKTFNIMDPNFVK